LRNKSILFLLMLCLVFSLASVTTFADEENESYSIVVKYNFYSGYVDEENLIYSFSGETQYKSPGDEVYVPSVDETAYSFNYHIDGYPDTIKWIISDKIVEGGGNYIIGYDDNGKPIKETLVDDDYLNFHTNSMIHEDVYITFEYTPYTDIAYLYHYFEQEDGSFKLSKTQKTNLMIYEIYGQEYDLSKYFLTVDDYEPDLENENNVLVGASYFRTVDEDPMIFKYYYTLIKSQEETTTEEEITTEEETTVAEETTIENETTEEVTTEEIITTEKETTTIVEEETTIEETTVEETTIFEEETTTEELTTEEPTLEEETTTTEEAVVPTLPPETTESSDEETEEETVEISETEEETITTTEEETTVILEDEELPKTGDVSSNKFKVLFIVSMLFSLVIGICFYYSIKDRK